MDKDIVVYCGMVYLDDKGKEIGFRKIFLEGSHDIIKNHLYRPITGTPTLFMKRTVFNRVNGFDDVKRYQDATLIYKLLANDFKMIPIKEFLVKVHLHDGERITNSNARLKNEQVYLENLKCYDKLLPNKQKKILEDKIVIITAFNEDKDNGIILKKILKKLKHRVLANFNFLNILNYFIVKKRE